MPSLPGQHQPILLELDLSEAPVDAPDDPLSKLRARGRRSLRPTLRALHEAGSDRRVVGLIARVGGLPWALTQELRQGIEAFAASGKPTVAWAESFDGGADLARYTLASAFGEIWMQPGGSVGSLGVGIETTFWRGALDKLGVQPEFQQRHEYKNAADVLQRTEYSPAHREATERLAASVFDDAVTTVAAARGLTVDRVRELAAAGPRTALEAVEVGLIDRLGYRDEVYAGLRARLPDDTDLLFADRWRPPVKLRAPKPNRRHVALVPVRGAIVTGRSRFGPGGRQAGSDTIAAELRAAGADDKTRAVVLQVDSPGGSAVASDTIWREVCRVRDAGKPVVVSMGEVAASGGYYVACPADVILAQPATLTGSIGVLAGKLAATGLLDRLGVSTGTVELGGSPLMYSSRRPFTDAERERLAAVVDAIYDDFVGKVALGRRRTRDEIATIARGRVWTGRDALEVGLVDQLGGLRDAVRIARARAGLPDDAPVRRALRVPFLARLGTATNSEDPRARIGPVGGRWPTLDGAATEAAAALGVAAEFSLLMPPVRLR
jgi:protease IV